MLCTAPAASGHFYQLTEQNSEMRETSLANFDLKRPAGNATNITEQWWSQWRRWMSILSDSCTYCRSWTPNMCWEQIHVRVWRQLYSHHVVIRRKMELQEFWIQNQLLSTSTCYSSSIQFTCSDRTCIQKIFVCDGRCHCFMGEDEASFCPNALLPIEALCATWIIFCATTEVVLLIRMSATEDGTAKMEMKKKPSARRSLRKNAPVKSNSYIPINGRNVIVHEAVLSTFTRWS